MLLVDGAGSLSFVNQQARDMFSLSSSDLGRRFQDLDVSFRPVELRSAIDQAAKGGSVVTITRGALPLALFGADGYGRRMGRISGFWLVMQSAAPLVMALVAERASDARALALAAGFAVVALACFAAIKRP